MTRRNLALDPSFRSITGFWEPLNGAVLTQSTAYAFYGDLSLRIEKSAQGASGFASASAIPVDAGLSYAASVYVRVPITIPASEEANLVMKVQWVNSLGLIISESSSAVPIVQPEDLWVRLTLVDTAPVGATNAFIRVYQLAPGSAGELFFADAVLFEQSDYVGGYLDNRSQAEENAIVNAALTQPTQKIGGMELLADITLGDLVLNTIDEDNTIWVCTDLSGWWGQADPQLPDIPRGSEDGSYNVTGRYQARQIELQGVFFPPTKERLGSARDRLVSASNLLRRGAWLRTNEEPTKAAFVRLSGRPSIVTVNAAGRTEFSIPLRAVDPVKYEWNDADPDGITTVTIPGDDGLSTVTNIGTADVTAVFRLTGPLGIGSTIYNSATDETITTTYALRDAGPVATVSSRQLLDNLATLTTTEPHYLSVGDVINVSNVGDPYDSGSGSVVVTAVSETLPYTVSYELIGADIPNTASLGQISLATPDVLEIDTYNKSVTFNGLPTGNRAKLEILIDWIKLAPGVNIIEFVDSIDITSVESKQINESVVTFTTTDAHFLKVGEAFTVNLPTEAELAAKILTNNVVTLTTEENHGFSVGDLIDVVSVEESTIVNKALTSNVATLTTAVDGGFVVNDNIVVDMASSATVIAKGVTSNTVSLKTSAPHKFSPGDSITVTFPSGGTITAKALTSNQATITTSTTHNFSVGDSITITMPTSAIVTQKEVSGSSVVLTTSTAHGFAVGDKVVVAFPATATLTGTRSYAGSGTGLITLNTSATHNFSVGDSISVNVDITDTRTATQKASSSTQCSLTIGTHNFAVGEVVTVAIGDARFDGTFPLASVTATTITYNSSGAVVSQVAASGTVTNNTIKNGYNGTKVIDSVTSTSLSYRYYGQDGSTSSTTYGSNKTLTNLTNQEINGTVTITSRPNPAKFSYNRGA